MGSAVDEASSALLTSSSKPPWHPDAKEALNPRQNMARSTEGVLWTSLPSEGARCLPPASVLPLQCTAWVRIFFDRKDSGGMCVGVSDPSHQTCAGGGKLQNPVASPSRNVVIAMQWTMIRVNPPFFALISQNLKIPLLLKSGNSRRLEAFFDRVFLLNTRKRKERHFPSLLDEMQSRWAASVL